MKIIWVRHGVTTLNKQNVYLGHLDPSLDGEGIRQAKARAHIISKTNVGQIYSSDLRRARETAEIIARNMNVKPVFTPALRELDFGAWDGLTYEEALKRDAGFIRQWYDDPFRLAPPNGETLDQLGKRIDEFLNTIITTHADETIVIISHGGPIRHFLSAAVNQDKSTFWIVSGIKHGGAVTVEKKDRGWTIVG